MRLLDPARGEGTLLRLLAVGHAMVGVAIYHRELRSMGRDGILGGVPYRGPKATAFWFLVPSPLIWTIGRLVGRAEAAGDWNAARAAHRLSLVSAAIASVCLPISGFWAWLAISVRGLCRAQAAMGRSPTS